MGSIRVGRAQAKPDTPGHVSGMHQGNQGRYQDQTGHHRDGTSDARRSTGIHWKRGAPPGGRLAEKTPGWRHAGGGRRVRTPGAR
ncbi:hypothetical protein ACFXDP_31440, partial [Streptomyces sp. NPDC059374]|uniref:hypothetical protein n=1 Tax=Streptomyces sp. NPDC059374 TaxID=3346814 RepID=UPI00367AB525